MRHVLKILMFIYPTMSFASDEIFTCYSSQVCNGPSGCESIETKLSIVVLDDVPKFVVKGTSLIEVSVHEAAYSTFWEDENMHHLLLFSGAPALVSFDQQSDDPFPSVTNLSCEDYE